VLGFIGDSTYFVALSELFLYRWSILKITPRIQLTFGPRNISLVDLSATGRYGNVSSN